MAGVDAAQGSAVRRLVIALMLLAVPVMAQDAPVETVNAYGSSLVGIWRVGRPSSIAVTGFFSPIKWGEERQQFCRIIANRDDLQAICTTGGPFQAGTVSMEGNHVHFAWGTMMLRMVLDGEMLDTGHLRGRFQFKVSGITAQSPASYEAVRVLPDATAPDHGGQGETLRRILEQGFAQVPHDGGQRTLPEPPQLGPVTALAYLGEEVRDGGPPRGDTPAPTYSFSVYLANFAQGQRLCGLHRRADGVVDDFRCS